MSAHDTLQRILDREAGKLDKMSETEKTPLSPDHLGTLEVLARCTKLLRAPTAQPPSEPAPGAPTEKDLEVVSG